ncbi:MAG: hypothetical protein EA001_01895 [Oscillatoriales cyanobacterium]|nr:MAG: hypothetical protein EA001_01895 [Oscillatoriales cyanobacterium]
MHKTLTRILGTAIGLATLTTLATQPAEAAKLTWKVNFFDEMGAAFGSGNFITDTEPQTFGVLERQPGNPFASGTYTTTNVVTDFNFQVGAVPWSAGEPVSGLNATRWVVDDGQLGQVSRTGYPTDYVNLGTWWFTNFYGRGRPVDKTLYMNSSSQPDQMNTWSMSYSEVPFDRWGDWFSNPATRGTPIPRYDLRGTWTMERVASTPEPGVAGAGLMMLGLWGIRQRSRRLQSSGSRAIDS